MTGRIAQYLRPCRNLKIEKHNSAENESIEKTRAVKKADSTMVYLGNSSRTFLRQSSARIDCQTCGQFIIIWFHNRKSHWRSSNDITIQISSYCNDIRFYIRRTRVINWWTRLGIRYWTCIIAIESDSIGMSRKSSC